MSLALTERPGSPVCVVAPGAADVTGWLAANKAEIDALVLDSGAVMLTGLPVRTPADVATAADVLLGPRMHPIEHDAAQDHLGDGIYMVADGPALDATCLHNTQSHTLAFPRLLLLACLGAPQSGGAVTLGDSRRVLETLPRSLADSFQTRGWRLNRTYLDFVGIPWATALGAGDRATAEEYCRRNAIDTVWPSAGGLITSQRRPALLTHPVTGEDCWFNTVLYFSRWSMEPDIRDLLLETYGDGRLPFDTAFGDGTDLTRADAMTIDAAYRSALLRAPWQAGDLILVDNIRMAHGRDAYRGDRTVVVAMGAPACRGNT